jgi:hypothetical protein
LSWTDLLGRSIAPLDVDCELTWGDFLKCNSGKVSLALDCKFVTFNSDLKDAFNKNIRLRNEQKLPDSMKILIDKDLEALRQCCFRVLEFYKKEILQLLSAYVFDPVEEEKVSESNANDMLEGSNFNDPAYKSMELIESKSLFP